MCSLPDRKPSPVSDLAEARRLRASTAKIRLIVNHEHVALVLRVKREMCVGENVRAA